MSLTHSEHMVCGIMVSLWAKLCVYSTMLYALTRHWGSADPILRGPHFNAPITRASFLQQTQLKLVTPVSEALTAHVEMCLVSQCESWQAASAGSHVHRMNGLMRLEWFWLSRRPHRCGLTCGSLGCFASSNALFWTGHGPKVITTEHLQNGLMRLECWHPTHAYISFFSPPAFREDGVWGWGVCI